LPIELATYISKPETAVCCTYTHGKRKKYGEEFIIDGHHFVIFCLLTTFKKKNIFLSQAN